MGCPDWHAIKTEYIAGGTSLRKLAEKHEVSFSTIQKKSMEEKWGDLRKKSRRKAEEKIVDSVSSKTAKRAVTIIKVADKLLEKALELAEMGVTDTQGLKHLSSALKDLKEIKGFKSELDIKEQEARIAKLRKEVEDQGADHKKEVVVTIEGGVSDAWLR